MQRVNRGGHVEVFLQTTFQCWALIQGFEHRSTGDSTVREGGSTDDTSKAVVGGASTCDRRRSTCDTDIQFDLPRQLARDAAYAFAELLDPLERIVVSAADDRRGRI